ncbi:MAG: hypothetical protein QNJ54_22845 [Prochloraceae cyanobacterium]|nr:hypothetical protein [Prochloraceae cyanobacterium]
MAVAAGNQGFLAIGDWLKSYKRQLKNLFCVAPLRGSLRDRILEIFRMK